MNFINKCIAHYYNKKHRNTLFFKKKEKVFLLQQNIKMKQSNKKLNHKKLRLFKIERKIEKLSYRLKLSHKIRIHSVFYISLLKKTNQNIEQYWTKIKIDKKEYKVKYILKKQKISRKVYYLIKWKEYFTEKNTWEFMKHLHNTQEMMSWY